MDYFDDIKIRDNKESLRSCVCPSLNEGWKKEKTMKGKKKGTGNTHFSPFISVLYT